jgi:hypothetical protein
MIISLIRASQQRRALMNQTRVYWNIAKTGDGRTVGAQKGLIRFFSISNPNDDQIDESLDFTRAWCKAIREGIGNVPMIDEQILRLLSTAKMSSKVYFQPSKEKVSGRLPVKRLAPVLNCMPLTLPAILKHTGARKQRKNWLKK